MKTDKLRMLVETIVRVQTERKPTLIGRLYYPVDIMLANGNILLRAFRILSIEGDKIRGITWKEEYCAPREKRKEVYSYFDLNDIARMECFDLGLEYDKSKSE